MFFLIFYMKNDKEMLLKFDLLNTCCNIEWMSNQEMVHHI
jgi:hypothetical protein